MIGKFKYLVELHDFITLLMKCLWNFLARRSTPKSPNFSTLQLKKKKEKKRKKCVVVLSFICHYDSIHPFLSHCIKFCGKHYETTACSTLEYNETASLHSSYGWALEVFLSSTKFRHSLRRTATWCSNATGTLSQIDHIAVSYGWRGFVQKCRS